MRSRVDQFIPALGGLVCLLALPGIATAQTDECTDASAATLGEIAAEDILQGTASSTTVCDTGCHATTNEAPVAAADSYATDQDVPLSVPAPGVLGNDTDGDGNSLTASLVSGATNGALTLNPDGSFSYTPNAGFSGSDSFSYLAADGTADSGPATVTLTINDVNDLPVAAAQNLSVTQNNPENIVLSYDDADGPGPYTFTVVSGPTNGVLGSDDGDASLTYTPNTGYTGPDSFTFRVNDGIDDSAVPAAVNVDVVAATPVVLLLDHFDRPDSTIVGNGWTELESPGTGIGIQGNRLVFLATNDATNRPMVTNTFPRAVSGQLFWDFEFDWSRTGSEGTYRLFMQLGDSSLMDPNSWDACVGINLI